MSQNPRAVAAKTMKFFERMFTQFFARANPDSTQPKPRFMKNTSMPQTSTQTVSAAVHSFAIISSAVGAGGAVGLATAGVMPTTSSPIAGESAESTSTTTARIATAMAMKRVPEKRGTDRPRTPTSFAAKE